MRASTEMMFFSFSHFLCGKCASPTIVERSTIPTSAKLLQMYVTHFGKCDIRYGKCDISALFYHNIGHLSRDCGHFVLLLSRVVRIILFLVFSQVTLRVCVYIIIVVTCLQCSHWVRLYNLHNLGAKLVNF